MTTFRTLVAALSGCPCTLVEPCSENCSCAHPSQSGGCQRCALYGSQDQRVATATRLAALREERDALRAMDEEVRAALGAPSGSTLDGAITLGDALERTHEQLADRDARIEALTRDRDSDALEVLCRVFDDGADEGFAEWQAWYNPSEWLHPSRALGAFIYGRLLAKRAFTPFEREAIDSLSQAMHLASGRVDGDGKVHVTITMSAANGIMHALSAALAAPAEEPSR